MSIPFVHLHCHSHYSLLDGAGTQQGEARLADRHDVLVVAENRQALGGQRTGGDVEDG